MQRPLLCGRLKVHKPGDPTTQERNTRSGERASKYTEKVWAPPVSGLGHLAEMTFGYENILNSSCGALSGSGGIMRPLARRKAERQADSRKLERSRVTSCLNKAMARKMHRSLALQVPFPGCPKPLQSCRQEVQGTNHQLRSAPVPRQPGRSQSWTRSPGAEGREQRVGRTAPAPPPSHPPSGGGPQPAAAPH